MSTGEMTPLFSIILMRRKLVAAVAAATLAAGILYTVFAAPVWEAKATIIFPVRTPSMLGAGNFEQSALAMTLGGPTPLRIYGGILNSERTLAYVAKNLGMKRRDVKDMRSIVDQAMENTITISVRDRDAEKARKAVALHLQALDAINRDLNSPALDTDADVLRDGLAKQKAIVRKAEQALLDFQARAKTAPMVQAAGSGKDSTVVAATPKWSALLQDLRVQKVRIDGQVAAGEAQVRRMLGSEAQLPSQVATVEKWRTQLADLEYDLKVKELTFSPRAPEVLKLRKQIKITREQLLRELNSYGKATRGGAVDPTGGNLTGLMAEKIATDAQLSAVKKLAALAPHETIELTRLTRELTTEGAILQQLQAQYKLADLQEQRNPNRWQLLDAPEVDEKPVNKSLSKNGALSLICGLFLGCGLAIGWPERRKPTTSLQTPETDGELEKAA